MENLLHLKAPGDWINDPNGFIFYKGEYHLFYQYFPCAPHWGTMHWGHAVSDDLIHWKHLGVAIYPSKKYDGNGAFSGSAIERDGMLWLYYTAVQYLGIDPENVHHADASGCLQSQVLLISEDGRTFDNLNHKMQVIPPFIDSKLADAHDCRDPKVWQQENRWYMTLGSTNRKTHTGVLLVMESRDGISWQINSRIEDESLGHTLECPDLFEVDGSQVLICSPMGNMSNSDYQENQATMRFAKFDGKQKSLSLDSEVKLLDYGMELYAPQSNVDEEGRRTVISWLRMPKPAAPEHNRAAFGRLWNGMMSLPRVISIRDGEIYTSVHPNVRRFFDENARHSWSGQGFAEASVDDQYRIKAKLSEGQTLNMHGLLIGLANGKVSVDRSLVISEDVQVHPVSLSPYVGEKCEIEVYMDADIAEVYINDGRYVITNWISQK